MREIKFRAWYKTEKTMRLKVEYDLSPMLGWPEGYELMQFTGLKDKNDKEIYEGDILDIKIWNSGDPKRVKLVVGGIYAGAFIFDNCQDYEKVFNEFNVMYLKDLDIGVAPEDEAIVIGNIYENPDLLNDEEDDDATIDK